MQGDHAPQLAQRQDYRQQYGSTDDCRESWSHLAQSISAWRQHLEEFCAWRPYSEPYNSARSPVTVLGEKEGGRETQRISMRIDLDVLTFVDHINGESERRKERESEQVPCDSECT